MGLLVSRVPDTAPARPADEHPSPNAPAAVGLGDVVELLLSAARKRPDGRAERTLTPDTGTAALQTVQAFAAGSALVDHVAPSPTTLLVLRGDMRLTWEDHLVELKAGSWIPLPTARHQLIADSDSAALVTVIRV